MRSFGVAANAVDIDCFVYVKKLNIISDTYFATEVTRTLFSRT